MHIRFCLLLATLCACCVSGLGVVTTKIFIDVPAAPTPTPAPTPAPTPVYMPGPPERGLWSYKNLKNDTCIMTMLAAQLNVTYTLANSTNLANVILNVPANASVVSGSCECNNFKLITLSWPVKNSNINNTMTLNYQMDDTFNSHKLKSVYFTLSPDVFVNSSYTEVVELTHDCDWRECQNITVPAADGVVAAITLISDGGSFSLSPKCISVPIAVGCALGGLVVMVLVLYLVRRRRNTARPYPGKFVQRLQ